MLSEGRGLGPADRASHLRIATDRLSLDHGHGLHRRASSDDSGGRPLLGVLVDRVDPWRLLSVTSLVQALGLVPLLAAGRPGTLLIVYLVVLGESVLAAVVEPARSTVDVASVPSEHLTAVNGALATTSSLARLIGGPLGGVLLALTGLRGIVLADAISFGAASALLAVGHTPARPRSARPATTRGTAPALPQLLACRPSSRRPDARASAMPCKPEARTPRQPIS